jgi:hypothetical protein
MSENIKSYSVISRKQINLKVTQYQALVLVTLLKKIKIEPSKTKIVVTNICNQIDEHFKKMSVSELMEFQNELPP